MNVQDKVSQAIDSLVAQSQALAQAKKTRDEAVKKGNQLVEQAELELIRRTDETKRVMAVHFPGKTVIRKGVGYTLKTSGDKTFLETEDSPQTVVLD